MSFIVMFYCIVPMFNSSATIENCLDSIFASALDEDICVICINDGSTDNTAQIVLDYVVRTRRHIELVEQKNGGAASARNAGIGLLKALIKEGEYFTFVDSDDTVGGHYFHSLLKGARDDYTDLCIGGLTKVFDDRTQTIVPVAPSEGDSFHFLMNYLQEKIFPSSCAKIYSWRLIGSILFDESCRIGEDIRASLGALIASNEICCISDCSYFADRSKKDSLTRNKNPDIENKNLLSLIRCEYNKFSQNYFRYSENEKQQIFCQISYGFIDNLSSVYPRLNLKILSEEESSEVLSWEKAAKRALKKYHFCFSHRNQRIRFALLKIFGLKGLKLAYNLCKGFSN